MAKDTPTKAGNTGAITEDFTTGAAGTAVVVGSEVKFREGYAPGDVAKETLYADLDNDGQVTASAPQRGTVVVQAGDTVTAAAAASLAQ